MYYVWVVYLLFLSFKSLMPLDCDVQVETHLAQDIRLHQPQTTK